MQSRLSAGIAGGLIAGLVFGAMMQMMSVPTPEGMRMPMLAMVAKIVGSESLAVGWIYHLFNSAIIGLIFGWILGIRIDGYSSGFGWGALYGFVWWILGGLILMPVFLGMQPFAPLMMEPMRMSAIGSLVGHLIYGAILCCFSWNWKKRWFELHSSELEKGPQLWKSQDVNSPDRRRSKSYGSICSTKFPSRRCVKSTKSSRHCSINGRRPFSRMEQPPLNASRPIPEFL